MRHNTIKLVVLFIMFLILSLVASPASAQTVSYDLGQETALLDAAFYAGEAADGSNVGGRQVIFYGISPDGSQVALKAINNATFQNGLFLVDVGDPSSWRRLSPDTAFSTQPILWTPDGSRVFVGDLVYEAATGGLAFSFESDWSIPGDGVPHGITRLASGNWISTTHHPDNIGENEILLLPILPNGRPDTSRQPVGVSDFSFGVATVDVPFVSLPYISPDGSLLLVAIYTNREPPTSVPDTSDVYLLANVQDIIAAPPNPNSIVSTLAPTSLADPNILDIRASDTAKFVHCMRCSEDSTLVFTCEDMNNVFNDSAFFATLAL